MRGRASASEAGVEEGTARRIHERVSISSSSRSRRNCCQVVGRTSWRSHTRPFFADYRVALTCLSATQLLGQAFEIPPVFAIPAHRGMSPLQASYLPVAPVS